jgi:hypothetical protein
MTEGNKKSPTRCDLHGCVAVLTVAGSCREAVEGVGGFWERQVARLNFQLVARDSRSEMRAKYAVVNELCANTVDYCIVGLYVALLNHVP